MTNKKKFLALVTETDTSAHEQIIWRKANRPMLRESQDIALKMLARLEALNWSQVELSKKMEVSPQQVNKILRGKENLTLETQLKIQSVLDIPILASY